jgi:NAD(P)H-dependent FMN reductase
MKILIIIGTTRPNRFSEKPAEWIHALAKNRKEITWEIADLRDYPLPFYNETGSPIMVKGKYSTEVAEKWASVVSSADGFIIVTGEYNHGYPAVLKNALDYIYTEWNKKAVGFVSYGGVGGARAVEQLRQVAIELQMTPIRSGIHLPWTVMAAANEPSAKEALASALEPFAKQAEGFLDQLIWWTVALKTARDTQGE